MKTEWFVFRAPQSFRAPSDGTHLIFIGTEYTHMESQSDNNNKKSVTVLNTVSWWLLMRNMRRWLDAWLSQRVNCKCVTKKKKKKNNNMLFREVPHYWKFVRAPAGRWFALFDGGALRRIRTTQFRCTALIIAPNFHIVINIFLSHLW